MDELKKYIKTKIKFLKQFGIYPNEKEKEHMYSLKTEVAVDNYVHDLFMVKL